VSSTQSIRIVKMKGVIQTAMMKMRMRSSVEVRI